MYTFIFFLFHVEGYSHGKMSSSTPDLKERQKRAKEVNLIRREEEYKEFLKMWKTCFLIKGQVIDVRKNMRG